MLQDIWLQPGMPALCMGCTAATLLSMPLTAVAAIRAWLPPEAAQATLRAALQDIVSDGTIMHASVGS